MTLPPKPRHILITGASGGIGAALAELYAAPGIHLSLHGLEEDLLKEVAAKARVRGATLNYQAGDVRKSEALKNWIGGCDGRMPLDLVIANAGTLGTQDGDEERAREIFDVNLTATSNDALCRYSANGSKAARADRDHEFHGGISRRHRESGL